MHKVSAFFRNRYTILIIGLLLGALTIIVIRFVTYHVDATHYHANFAVYLNGQQEKFQDPAYYQEVTACTVGGTIKPEQRAHMHDNVSSVLHVHDDGVTWGQFFENLGWYVGPDFIQTRSGTMYKADGDSLLHVVLNGDDRTGFAAITNQVIGDRDKLLLSFGTVDNAQLQREYDGIPTTAAKYDQDNDPASCAGQMQKITLQDRMRHLF